MDAQPKIGGFGCFKGVLQIPFFLLMQFHKAIFYFNPKMGHMLYLAIVDKLNRAGFVVAPYSIPEEVLSVKSVSGPARHVGEADKRVRDSRGGSPCGENPGPYPPVSSRALCGPRRSPESDRVSTAFPQGLRRQHIEDR